MPIETSKLVKMREKIDESRRDSDRLEGELNQLRSQLKKDFGCEDLAAARKKYESLKSKSEKLKDEIDQGVAKLEKDHEW